MAHKSLREFDEALKLEQDYLFARHAQLQKQRQEIQKWIREDWRPSAEFAAWLGLNRK